MRIKKTTAAAVVIALGVAGFLVHATVFFDPRAFVRDHARREEAKLMAAALTGRPPAHRADLAERARWHAGEPPCFAYDPPRATDEDIASVVSDFAATGAVALAVENVTLFAEWSVADERLRHGSPGDEEILTAYDDLGWYERLLLTLNRGRIVEAARELVREQEEESRARAARREAELSPEQVDVLRTTWERHRSKLPVPALLSLKSALEQRARDAAAR